MSEILSRSVMNSLRGIDFEDLQDFKPKESEKMAKNDDKDNVGGWVDEQDKLSAADHKQLDAEK